MPPFIQPIQSNLKLKAIVIEKNRIIYVGDNAKALAHRTSKSQIIDAKGKTVMPGIIDSHYHLGMGSFTLDELYLDEVKTSEQLNQAIRNYENHNPLKHGLSGADAAMTSQALKPLTRQHLDTIVSNKPVALFSRDFHTVWV